jgi:hypothetical protein
MTWGHDLGNLRVGGRFALRYDVYGAICGPWTAAYNLDRIRFFSRKSPSKFFIF